MEEKKPKLNKNGLKGLVIWYFLIILSFLILIFSSGRLDWLNAWIYFFISILYQTINTLVAIRVNPEMLNSRNAFSKEGTKLFDKFFAIIYIPMIILSMVIMALDSVIYTWLALPFWTLLLGVIISIPGFFFGFYALITNPYFELSVRVQMDRNQKVVNSGPYKIVKHPGYLGQIILLISTLLMLGSGWGFLPIGIIIILFIVRTALEDRTLKRELNEYEEYAEKTRYRLFPFIW